MVLIIKISLFVIYSKWRQAAAAELSTKKKKKKKTSTSSAVSAAVLDQAMFLLPFGGLRGNFLQSQNKSL
jgi:hypothetical protein